MKKNFSTAAVVLALLGLGLSAQEDPKKPEKPEKPDKEVTEKLGELKKVVADKKAEHDAEGVAIIDQLLQKMRAGMHDKDQDKLVDGLEGVLMSGRLRDPSNLGLYTTAAMALGYLEKDGAKVLHDAYEKKRFPTKPEWVPLREVLLKNLGKTKEEYFVKFLMDEASRASEAALMGAAGEALGNFEGSDQKIRKEIVNKLLIRYGELDSRSRQLDSADIEAQNAREYLAVISDRWNTTLGKMSKQNLRAYPDWQEWYNKNKNEDWK